MPSRSPNDPYILHVSTGSYYVSRASAPQTRHVTKLLQHSLFQPLSRVRYEIVGQDQVFEQLFTVLNQHSKRQSASPLVILLCGQCICISTPHMTNETVKCLNRAKWTRKELPSPEMYACPPNLHHFKHELNLLQSALFSVCQHIP